MPSRVEIEYPVCIVQSPDSERRKTRYVHKVSIIGKYMGFLQKKLEKLSAAKKTIVMNAVLISRAIYHASPTGYGRGKGAKVPKDYQFIPWDMLNVPWLHSLEQHMSEEQKEEHAKEHTRRRILIADEGGLGKTFSACICIEKAIRANQSVLVIVPPALRREWVVELKKFQIPIAQQYTVNGLNQTLEPGVAYVVSRGSIQNGPEFDLEVHTHLNNIGLVVVDECHYGMIAAGEGSGAADDLTDCFKDRIEPFLRGPKQALLLTATPMRNGWNDLKVLFELLEDDSNRLGCLDSIWDWTGDWILEFGRRWLLPLETYASTGVFEAGSTPIHELLEQYCPQVCTKPWLKELVESVLNGQSDVALDTAALRGRLVRDLHPFGRYFHCTVRDDLGRGHVGKRFRKRTDTAFHFESDELPLADAFPEGMTRIAQSCILNVLDQERYSSLERPDGISEEQIRNAWVGDQRLEKVMEHLETSIKVHTTQFPAINHQAGTAIFARHVGTQNAIYEHIRSVYADNKNVVIERTALEDEDKKGMNKRSRVNDITFKCKSEAKNRRYVILVCGDSVAEGQNFLWANQLFNWDLHGGAENIAQRSWRLDRLLPHNNPLPPYDKCFNVYHFVVPGLDDVESINETFRNNRRVLGERRYIEEDLELIGLDGLPVESTWTRSPRNIALLDAGVKKEHEWATGEGGITSLEEAGEQLWHRTLAKLLGWSMDSFLPEPGTKEHVDKFTGIPSQDASSIGDWFGLLWSGDLEERRSLKRLRGIKKPPETQALPRLHGPPSTEHMDEVIRLLPTGKIPRSLSYDIENQPLPHNIPVWPNQKTWFAVKPDMLSDAQSTRQLRTRLFWDGKESSGLFTAPSKDGPWKSISIADLNSDDELRTHLVALCQWYESALLWEGEQPRFGRVTNEVHASSEDDAPPPPVLMWMRRRAYEEAKKYMTVGEAEAFLEKLYVETPSKIGDVDQPLKIVLGGK